MTSWWVGADRAVFSRLVDRHTQREQREMASATRRYLRHHTVTKLAPPMAASAGG